MFACHFFFSIWLAYRRRVIVSKRASACARNKKNDDVRRDRRRRSSCSRDIGASRSLTRRVRAHSLAPNAATLLVVDFFPLAILLLFFVCLIAYSRQKSLRSFCCCRTWIISVHLRDSRDSQRRATAVSVERRVARSDQSRYGTRRRRRPRRRRRLARRKLTRGDKNRRRHASW